VPRSSNLRGCLLDVDGTLIDSNDAHARSWVDVLKDAGFDVHYQQVRPLIGMGGDKLVHKLTGLDVDKGRGKELTERRRERFTRHYLAAVKAFPGAHELIARMKYEGLRLVIATSAQEEELNGLLERAGLVELIEHSTTSDDAEHSKPDPDIVKSALARGGLAPKEALMLGDTPYDIEAAGRAGLSTIAFRCGGWWSDAELSGAREIYDSPVELSRLYEESALGSRFQVPGF
jgi:HAD superfamily hydrolase (TIGR01549 family)